MESHDHPYPEGTWHINEVTFCKDRLVYLAWQCFKAFFKSSDWNIKLHVLCSGFMHKCRIKTNRQEKDDPGKKAFFRYHKQLVIKIQMIKVYIFFCVKLFCHNQTWLSSKNYHFLKIFYIFFIAQWSLMKKNDWL